SREAADWVCTRDGSRSANGAGAGDDVKLSYDFWNNTDIHIGYWTSKEPLFFANRTIPKFLTYRRAASLIALRSAMRVGRNSGQGDAEFGNASVEALDVDAQQLTRRQLAPVG